MEEAIEQLRTWLDTFENAFKSKSGRLLDITDLQTVFESTSSDGLLQFLTEQDKKSPNLRLKTGLRTILQVFEHTIRICGNMKGNTSVKRLECLFGMIQCTLMIGHNIYRDLKAVGRQLEVISSMCHSAETADSTLIGNLLSHISSEIVKFSVVIVSQGPDEAAQSLGQTAVTLLSFSNEIKSLQDHTFQEQIQQSMMDIQTQSLNERMRAILEWLDPDPFDITHAAIKDQREANTGQWFIAAVVDWLKDQDGDTTLWCQGIPGAGKTVLVSSFIDFMEPRLEDYQFDALAYVYFDYTRQESQTLAKVYASIAGQLLNQKPTMEDAIGELYRQHKRGRTRPSAQQLISVLADMAKSHRILLVFDALDEALDATRNDVVSQLSNLVCKKLRLLVTSRPRLKLSGLTPSPRMSELVADPSDLDTFIRAKLKHNADAQDALGDDAESLIPSIVQGILSRAAGMFLLVVFQIQEICSQSTAYEMLEASQTMPTDPGQIYTRTLHQIDLQSRSRSEMAKKILAWLVLAKRPLTLEALAEALAIETDTSRLNARKKPNRSILTDVCKGLIVIDKKSNLVRLAHLTVQDFLLRRLSNLDAMRPQICIDCLTYLSFEPFRGGPSPDHDTFVSRTKQYPFLDYAVFSLVPHLKDLGEVATVAEAVFNFTTSRKISESYLQLMYGPQVPGYLWFSQKSYPTESSAYHMGALLGYETAFVLLLNRHSKTEADSHDVDRRTPLSWAAWNGHEKVVQLLLENTILDINSTDTSGYSPFLRAVQQNHVEVACRLLDGGADVTVRDEYGGTALHLSARNGNEAMTKCLLHSHPASAFETNSNGAQPLFEAAQGGHQSIVHLLLEAGADVNFRDNHQGTALMEASREGREGVVELLIQHSALINAQNGWGETAAHWAAGTGNERVVELLLNHGADCNIQDSLKKRAPIHGAAARGNDLVVEILLNHGADIDILDTNGESPLFWAARKARETVVSVLLRHQANVTLLNLVGETALLLAAGGRSPKIVKALLDHGADPNIRDHSGQSCLHIAAGRGLVEVVESLLEAGAETEARNFDGETALAWTAWNGHDEVVKVLIEKGNADLNTRDEGGNTPLLRAAWNGHLGVVETLVGTRAVEVNARSKEGQTPLMRAEENEHLLIVNLLRGLQV